MAAQDAQDYDADAIVVHMGCFEVPLLSEADDSKDRASAAPQGKVELVIDGGRTKSISGVEPVTKERTAAGGSLRKVQMQLYSVAAPGMRKQPETTQELAHYKGWCEPVNVKSGWLQVQKGYFDAPGELLAHTLCCVCCRISFSQAHAHATQQHSLSLFAVCHTSDAQPEYLLPTNFLFTMLLVRTLYCCPLQLHASCS